MIGYFVLIYTLFSILCAFRLRSNIPFAQRITDFNWQVLVLIDIIAAFVIFAPFYVIGLVDHHPGNGQTISSFSYRNHIQDKMWAAVMVTLIDKLFHITTSQENHCEKAYNSWIEPLSINNKKDL